MKGSQRERLDFPFLLDDKHLSNYWYWIFADGHASYAAKSNFAAIIISFLLPSFIGNYLQRISIDNM